MPFLLLQPKRMTLKKILDYYTEHRRWFVRSFLLLLAFYVLGFIMNPIEVHRDTERFIAVSFIREDRQIAISSNRARREFDIWREFTYAMLQQRDVPFEEVDRNIGFMENLNQDLRTLFFDQRLKLLELREMEDQPVRLKVVMNSYFDSLESYPQALRHMRNKVRVRKAYMDDGFREVKLLTELSRMLQESALEGDTLRIDILTNDSIRGVLVR